MQHMYAHNMPHDVSKVCVLLTILQVSTEWLEAKEDDSTSQRQLPTQIVTNMFERQQLKEKFNYPEKDSVHYEYDYG